MNQEKLNKELIEYAKNGNLNFIKSLIEKGADIHTNNNESLRVAVNNNHLEVVKYLVAKGADIHFENNWILRIASERGHLGVVKYLVEKGADIHTNNDEFLRLAAKNNHLEILQYFLYDCKIKVNKEDKDWLLKNKQEKILELVEKRDLLFKLNQNVIEKDSIDYLNKKVKI